jgi:hypothetical protein
MTHPLITAFGYVHEVIDTQRTTADLPQLVAVGMTRPRGARCRGTMETRAATLYPVGRSDPNHDACITVGAILRRFPRPHAQA